MTRVEFLIVICIALIGIYLVVRYQKTGEVFQISWRKAAGKPAPVAEKPSPETGPVTNAPEQTPRSYQAKTNWTVSSMVQKTNNENTPSEIPGMRLGEAKKQRVPVPTNAVWYSPPPRKGPGVRIAFP